MPNPLHTSILNIYDLFFCFFYGLSPNIGYLMSNQLYIHILNIYDFVWFDFMAYQPLWVI